MAEKYILIYTDGYEIYVKKYNTEKEAIAEMTRAYNDSPPPLDEQLADMSYINTSTGEAKLYSGEEVLIWRIVEI